VNNFGDAAPLLQPIFPRTASACLFCPFYSHISCHQGNMTPQSLADRKSGKAAAL